MKNTIYIRIIAYLLLCAFLLNLAPAGLGWAEANSLIRAVDLKERGIAEEGRSRFVEVFPSARFVSRTSSMGTDSPYIISPDTDLTTVFPNNNPLVIEVGYGQGRYFTNIARDNLDFNFIGIERSKDYLSILVRRLKKNDIKLPNLKFITANDFEVFEIQTKEGFVSEIWYVATKSVISKDLIPRLIKAGGRLYISSDCKLGNLVGYLCSNGFSCKKYAQLPNALNLLGEGYSSFDKCRDFPHPSEEYSDCERYKYVFTKDSDTSSRGSPAAISELPPLRLPSTNEMTEPVWNEGKNIRPGA